MPFKTDGNFSTPSATGNKRWFAPFPDNQFVAFDQDFIVAFDSFSPGVLNGTYTGTFASYGSGSTFRLVKEGPLNDLGGGIAKFTRTYYMKPASRDEFESFSYNFIGYYGVYGINVSVVTGRDRFTRTVNSKVSYTYYFCGTGLDATTPADIPSIEAQEYKVSGTGSLDVDWLADSPPFTLATSPSRATYESWIAAGSWIPAEDSVIRRIEGNLYERRTRYVKAQ